MFWDIILDPMRNLLSNDISYWMVAALVVAFVVTRASSIAAGSPGMREEFKFGATLFIFLVAAFYLP